MPRFLPLSEAVAALPPTERELAVLHDLQARSALAHGKTTA
jgi:hypothetical protein